MRTAFALAVVLTLAGCATPYTQNGMGFTGWRRSANDHRRHGENFSARKRLHRSSQDRGLRFTEERSDRARSWLHLFRGRQFGRRLADGRDRDTRHDADQRYGSTAFTTYSPGLVHSFREAWRGRLCSILQGELPGDAPGSTGSGQSRAEISTEVELGVFRHRELGLWIRRPSLKCSIEFLDYLLDCS